MRQRPRTGRRAPAGLNPAPWLHALTGGLAGLPARGTGACWLRGSPALTLWDSPGHFLRHTQDLPMVSVYSLASPQLPFK